MSARPLSNCLRARLLARGPQSIQRFSTRSSLRAADHGDHYDPPSGYLFGVKPGQKYVKEGWENIWYYGFIGSLLVAGVAYIFKPDTSYVYPRFPWLIPLLKRGESSACNRHYGMFCAVLPAHQKSIQKLTCVIGYKHGLSKKPDEDWKLRASWKTQTRPSESKG